MSKEEKFRANISEKEKRAIENAKEYVENEEILSISTFDIKTLLNLIKNQRKEAEDLKDVQQQICNEELLKKEYVQNNYIRKDKIEKELLEPINKERQATYKKFMKKGKDDYHGVEGSVLQELNWVVGTIEELLEE